MEKFLKDYVKMFAECNDDELTKQQISQIVNSLMMEDEIWDTLDHYIDSYIADIKA